MAEQSPWPAWLRVAFRVAFVFWALICLDGELPADVIWWLGGVGRWLLKWPMLVLEWPTAKLTAWLAVHVFHLTGDAARQHQTGSGDTALAWTNMAATLLLTIAIALIWTVVAEVRRWRTDYRVLAGWLQLMVRFTLATVLLAYGFNKVFPLQFPVPGEYVLHETFGQASPMKMLWTFMGVSPAYEIFSGLAEVLPGVLLLFRRTATLGALLACAVFTNVVMLNFCYDVPVKLYSSLNLLAGVFLLLPQAATLWRFLVLHRSTQLVHPRVATRMRPRLRVVAYCLEVLVIGHLLWTPAHQSLRAWRNMRSAKAGGGSSGLASGGSLDGSWMIDASTGWPEGKAWKTVQIGKLRYQSVDYFEVVNVGGEQANYAETIDQDHRIHFLATPADLRWSLTSQGATLEGTWRGQTAKLTMHRAPEAYPLFSRGFHWVQEYPYNR